MRSAARLRAEIEFHATGSRKATNLRSSLENVRFAVHRREEFDQSRTEICTLRLKLCVWKCYDHTKAAGSVR